MTDLARIGIAIGEDLLSEFDELIAKRGYTNRSEAFRDLIRNELSNEIARAPDADVCGTITIIYDHHVRQLMDKLIDLQHRYHSAIPFQYPCSSGSR